MLTIKRLNKKIIRRFKYHFLWSIKCCISPDKIFNFLLADGSRFDYPLKSAIGRSLFSEGFEIEEIDFVRRSLKLGDIFFDVGANAGLYTIIAAKQVGNSGHVYAFEPGQRELKLLRHNIAINNLTNVTIVERAVSNTQGKAEFAISRDGAMNSLSKTNHPGQKIEEWQTVEVTTLDDVVREFSIKKVNFVKIDVEGAEKLVFEGAKKLLKLNEKIIFLFEASDLNAVNFSYTVKELISEMISLGLFVYYFTDLSNLIAVSPNKIEFSRRICNFIASNVPVERVFDSTTLIH